VGCGARDPTLNLSAGLCGVCESETKAAKSGWLDRPEPICRGGDGRLADSVDSPHSPQLSTPLSDTLELSTEAQPVQPAKLKTAEAAATALATALDTTQPTLERLTQPWQSGWKLKASQLAARASVTI